MSNAIRAHTETVPPPEHRARLRASAGERTALLGLSLVAFVAVALVFRLYGLTGYGIWFDEAYHIALVRLPSTGDMLAAVLANPPSDPLYVLLLRGWAAMFGTGDMSVRMLSVIFGTLTVPATFALGAVLGGRTAGLLGALLLAVSPYAVEFSQEAALYALGALLATLALALGIWWQRTGRGGWAYALTAVLALYSHYVVAVVLALFVAGSLLPYFSAAWRVRRVRFLWTNVAAFALWLPWLVPMVWSWMVAPVSRSSLPQDLTLSAVAGTAGQYAAGTAALLTGSRWLIVLGALALGGMVLAGWVQSGRAERRVARIVLLLAAVVFLVPAVAAGVSGRWLFVPHMMLFVLPSLLALGGAAAAWSFGQLRAGAFGTVLARVGTVAAVGLLALTEVFGLAPFYEHPPHGADGLGDLAAILNAEERFGEDVYVTPPALAPSLAQYFPEDLKGLPEDFDLKRIYLPYDAATWHDTSEARLDHLQPGDRFWLVYRAERDEGGVFLSDLRSRFELLESRAFDFATLYHFEVR